MACYAEAELRALEAELLYTPKKLRRAHLGRLEGLIPELDPDQRYPYDYIFFRVTRFRPDSGKAKALSGRALRHDLGLLLRRLSPAVPQREIQRTGSVVPLGSVASEYRVTPKTVRRWGLLGLPLCYYILENGRAGWGVRRQALDRFLAERRARPARPMRKISDAERKEILAQARALRREAGAAPAGVVRRLAEETGRSPARIRRLLRKYDGHHSAKPALPAARSGLTPAERRELVRLYRSGVSARTLAKRHGCSVATTYRVLHHALVEQALGVKTRYVPSPEFAGPGARKTCLGDNGLFTYPPGVTPEMMKAPAGLPPYLRALYDIPLLSREEEKRLFRKYNYLKCRAAMVQEKIRCAGYRAALLEQFEEFRKAAEAVRRILIRCNLRLVVSIAKRHVGPLAPLLDLVSEGNMCLIRAVECYDYTRNARLATYATWAISKHFARVVPERNYRMATFVTGHHEMIEATGDVRPDPQERRETVAYLKSIIARAATGLTEKERTVIHAHFGTDGRPARTLEEIGKLFGVTRERIRQIEARALEKLRALIGPEVLDGLT